LPLAPAGRGANAASNRTVSRRPDRLRRPLRLHRTRKSTRSGSSAAHTRSLDPTPRGSAKTGKGLSSSTTPAKTAYARRSILSSTGSVPASSRLSVLSTAVGTSPTFLTTCDCAPDPTANWCREMGTAQAATDRRHTSATVSDRPMAGTDSAKMLAPKRPLNEAISLTQQVCANDNGKGAVTPSPRHHSCNRSPFRVSGGI
jgi:hypothetical protein